MSLRAIVLAAGRGTRMHSEVPKVLFPIAGRPLLAWVLDAVAGVSPNETLVVVGHGADQVTALLPADVRAVVQEPQLGTGHAVMAALAAMGEVAGDTVLVVPGDTPLLRPETLRALVAALPGATAALLTARMPDPAGYGRVRREGDRVLGIVEDRDATPEQRAIDEVAVSTYVFEGAALAGALGGLAPDNDQGEYYLTDAIGLLAASGTVRGVPVADPAEVQGVNSHAQLAQVSADVRRRINAGWMAAGVWMLDPERVYLDAAVSLEAGARLYPEVHLEGSTTVAAEASVGPQVFAVDSAIGPGARVWYAVLRGAEVGEGAQVGPFASLRPGTRLASGSKVGTFVETKNTVVGRGSKVPHLSYMGDATIGEEANVGAGTITCNYDGRNKHRTVIGDRAFIGSDTMLVAPVQIGDDAVTGAGSAITRDVPAGALGVERSQQREVPGYAAKKARKTQKKG
ncbi:MAG: UDP-N-acetylglucosamine diphosphorylase/glucosamine-1-phosphate N-acetyltransferase [Actinobacteria bacterium RBG_16_70_17]|nr:MAG: UDP-N-acetylglucosamine diphosphorylase/glucosamine-1-phosphate N-acetyltransferase [Actinobacteria bacterium RBG_16_70_17]